MTVTARPPATLEDRQLAAREQQLMELAADQSARLREVQYRVEQLQKRGYAKAGIYDPPGVGGTHVIYVLQYADQPGVIVVKRRVMITGDQLVDSQPSFQDGQAVVSFRFDSAGGRRFAKATQENVGKPFAIILDNKVISAPRINDAILGGAGIILGSFTTESANNLAVLLRSGKLPVALRVVEERTVGPDLGADSIERGVIAGLVGTAAIILLMLFAYLRFGVYATIALVVNVVLWPLVS